MFIIRNYYFYSMDFLEKLSYLYLLNNNTNYIKELASGDNSEKFKIELLKLKQMSQKYFMNIFLILLFPLFISIFLRNYSKLIFFIFIFFSCVYLISIFCLNEFEKSYKLFINFCQSIIKYENIQKNIFRILQYNSNIKEDYKNIINNLCEELLLILNNKNFINSKENDLYNEETYYKIKGQIFINLFNEYEEIFCLNQYYIFIFWNNYLNIKLNKFIKILNYKSIDLFNLNEDWSEIIKNYDENIKNIKNLYQEKENKFLSKVEIIYNIMISNCELNNQLQKLILQIKDNENDSQHLEELLNDIIFKKQNSIAQLIKLKEEYSNKKNEKLDEITNNNLKEEEKENQKENKKTNDTSISLLEIELGKIKKDKIKKENEYISNVNPFDIIKGQKSVQGLKMGLISELEEYYSKIKLKKKDNE